MTKILFKVAFCETKDHRFFERYHNLYPPRPKGVTLICHNFNAGKKPLNNSRIKNTRSVAIFPPWTASSFFHPHNGANTFLLAAYSRSNTPNAGTAYIFRGCADLICNTGTSLAYFHPMADGRQMLTLAPGRLYLWENNDRLRYTQMRSRMRASRYPFLAQWFLPPLRRRHGESVDSTVEFDHTALRAVMLQTESLDSRLDEWFDAMTTSKNTSRSGRYDFIRLRNLMYSSGGMISVTSLAWEMCVSRRTLERIFKENVGIPPKEFLRIVRFGEVLKRLSNRSKQGRAEIETHKSLLQTAFELGYYDHSHLTNEFKKYAGVLPSELSLFYKIRIAGDGYF